MSKIQLEELSNSKTYPFPKFNVFKFGARWMHCMLNINSPEKRFKEADNYLIYGLIKYGISGLFFLISALYFYKIHLSLLPLSVLIFYFIEVHFLFLFPLLVDQVKTPILVSVQQTYKTGLFKSLWIVLPLGLFMVFGLFNLRSPLRNWYIGCMAIIIWYKNEVRDRIQSSI